MNFVISVPVIRNSKIVINDVKVKDLAIQDTKRHYYSQFKPNVCKQCTAVDNLWIISITTE